MTDYNNLSSLRHSEQMVVEHTVRELDLRKRESGRLSVLKHAILVTPY